MRFENKVYLDEVSSDTASEDIMVLVNKEIKRRNFGSVYSKGFSIDVPSIFTTPLGSVTPSQNILRLGFASQTARTAFMAPELANGTPGFRAIKKADISDFLEGDYIRNQFASAQTGNFWIKGKGFIQGSGASPTLALYRTDAVDSVLRLSTNFSGGSYVDINPYITGFDNGGFEIKIDGTRRFNINKSNGYTGIGVANAAAKLHIRDYTNSTFRIDNEANNSAYGYFQVNTDSTPYLGIQAGDYLSYRNIHLNGLGGSTIVGSNTRYTYDALQVNGTVWSNSALIIENGAPTAYFKNLSSRGAAIHVNSNVFYLLRLNDSRDGWQTNGTGRWPLTINLEDNTASFGGAIQQAYTINKLVYADGNGQLIPATQSNVMDVLGDSAYIKNQFASAQSASYWVGGNAIVGPYAHLGNTPRFLVSGTHSTANFSLYSMGYSSLDSWASEPGLTFDGAGIGNNVNNSPYYGRRNPNLPQSYVRFYNGAIYFAGSTTETIYPDSSAKMVMNNLGYLGINKINAEYYLDVEGEASIYGHQIGRGGGASITNLRLGQGALANNTSGLSNVALGQLSLNSNSTGSFNTALGYYSLRNNSSGTFNTSIGYYNLWNNTTGNYNVGVGITLQANVSGSYNIALGYNALTQNVAKNHNVAIGNESQYNANNSNTSVNTYNVSIGSFTLRGSSNFSANTGTNNTAIGAWNLTNNTSGSYNSSLGYNSLVSNTSGEYNTSMGFSTNANNTTGSGNISIGPYSLAYNSAGNYGIAIGHYAQHYANNTITPWNNWNIGIGYYSVRGSGNASINTGNYNVGLGGYTLAEYTSGHFNVAIGHASQFQLTTGEGNTGIGDLTLYHLTTGSNNVALGKNALYYATTISQAVAIGYQSMMYQNNGGSSYNTAVGFEALRGSITPSANTGAYNSAFGYRSLIENSSGSYNTALGYASLLSNTTGSGNTAIGLSSLIQNTTGSNNSTLGMYAMNTNTTGHYNTAIGNYALEKNTTGSHNVAIGNYAFASNTVSSYTVAIGSGALRNFATSGDNFNVAIGADAMYGTSTISANTGAENVSIGFRSMLYLTSGNWNNAMGTYAFNNLSSGSNNNAIGNRSQYLLTTGNGNISQGTYTLYYNQSGSGNTAIGHGALFGTNTSTHNYNTAVGFQSGSSISTGGYNTIIGQGAGYELSTGSGNTFIGDQSGRGIVTGSYNVIVGPINNLPSSLSNTMVFGIANNERFRVDLSGNLLLGHTISQGYRLDVNGAINYTTQLSVGGNAGTANQVLKSAGTGSANVWGFVNYSEILGTPTITGTANYITQFTGTNTLGNSIIYNHGSRISIGAAITNTIDYKLFIDSGTASGNGLFINGSIVATDNSESYSDRRLKSHIKALQNPYDILKKISGYTYIKNGKQASGVIAQEIREVMPWLTKKIGKYYTVNYDGLHALHIQSTKKIVSDIEKLQNEIVALKNRIQQLENAN